MPRFNNPVTVVARNQFTFQDVRQFQAIESKVISADRNWIAFGVWPEQGCGEVRIKQVNGDTEYDGEVAVRASFNMRGPKAGRV